MVGDPGVERAGLVEKVSSILKAGGIATVVFTDVESDPATRSVDEGVVLGKDHKADVVVGIGGGSALDTAKAIGLMLTNKGNIRDYVGIDKVPLAGAPVIAVPTTAGTGSELTIWSVLSDKVQRSRSASAAH